MSEAPLGSRDNPLTLKDLPFTVPATGRYWLVYGDHAVHMPESPAGSVLALGQNHDMSPTGRADG